MKKKKIIFASLLYVALALLLFSSCNNNSGEKAKSSIDSALTDSKQIDSLTAKKKKVIEYKFATVEANFPSPFEIVNDLHKYDAPFNKELLNPFSNVDKYITSYKKEVNFGIYGIDLAYINFYGKNQAMISYYTAIQKIAKDLNMDKVFDEYAMRFKSNSDNHDSVLSIVDNVFNETDRYLRKNERFVAASHILAGALIELNYLSLNLVRDIKRTSDNGPFFEKIYNENLYIYHLIKLFEEYTDKDSKDLLSSLKSYSTAYNEIIKTNHDLTPEKINKVILLTNDLRNKMIE